MSARRPFRARPPRNGPAAGAFAVAAAIVAVFATAAVLNDAAGGNTDRFTCTRAEAAAGQEPDFLFGTTADWQRWSGR